MFKATCLASCLVGLLTFALLYGQDDTPRPGGDRRTPGSASGSTSPADAFNYSYLMNDNWEWSSTADSASKRPVLKHFYKKPSDFYSYHSEDFDLHVNPVLYIGAGKDNQRDERLTQMWDAIKRVRATVKGVSGDDSSEYELMGGTRLSERRRPVRRAQA